MGTEIQQGPTGATLIPLDRAQLGPRPGARGEPRGVSVRPDGIHQRGRAAVLAGQRAASTSRPGPGSTRWGLSLDVRLDPAAEQHLDALATEASAHAGPGQWLTGARGSSHLTVTYLERTWREVDADDEDVRRYAALVAALAAGTPPLRWQITGLALADRGVLAMAEPVDAAPGAVPGRGPRAPRRAGCRGGRLPRLDLVGDPAALRRRRWPTGAALIGLGSTPGCRCRPSWPRAERVEVVRYAYDGVRTAPVALSAAALPGVPEGAAGGAHP
jgi:hypothetical protein